MSRGEVLFSSSKTSVHEDIIREIEETDWTIDPSEQGDNDTEKDDFNFNFDELECVDEDVEEEKREDGLGSVDMFEAQAFKGCRRRPNTVHDKHRHHPYSRKSHGNRYSVTNSAISRRSRSSFEDGSDAYVEQKPPFEFERKAAPSELWRPPCARITNECDDTNVSLDELELEEVDCYDEDDHGFMDDASVAGETVTKIGGGHNDNTHCSKIHDVSKVEDDFLDLCEDIDVEAMRRAAAATDIAVCTDEFGSPDIILPTRKNLNICGTLFRVETDVRKNGSSSSQCSRNSSKNARRDDEARRRHHHYVSRDEHYKSMQNGRRYDETTQRYYTHKKFKCLGKDRPSTLSQNCLSRNSLACNAEIVSVEGPLAQGWCSNDNDNDGSCEDMKTSSVKEMTSSSSRLRLQQKSKAGWYGCRCFSIIMYLLCAFISLLEICSYNADFSQKRSAKCLQYLIRSAVDEIVRIPSLLDMYIEEPKQLQTIQTISSDKGTASQLCLPLLDEASNKQGCHENKTECSDVVPRSFSLLYFNVSPPDRQVMRQYAISLNNRELTKRPIEERPGNRLEFAMICERSRNPRMRTHESRILNG